MLRPSKRKADDRTSKHPPPPAMRVTSGTHVPIPLMPTPLMPTPLMPTPLMPTPTSVIPSLVIPPPTSVPSTTLAPRRPGQLKKTHPSFVSVVPLKYQEIIMPYMQIPSQEMIDEATTVSSSLEDQVELARKKIKELNDTAMALGLNIQLTPNDEQIEHKITNNDASYWLRTGNISESQLENILIWLEDKINKQIMYSGKDIIYLIIDFQNVFGCYQDFTGRIPKIGDHYDPVKLRIAMKELAHILCSQLMRLYNNPRNGIPIGIILCAQNHNLDYNPDFYNLIDELNRCSRGTGMRNDIIVIVTHNRAEFDDFMLAVTGNILNNNRYFKQKRYYILTSDRLSDLTGIDLRYAVIKSIDDHLIYYYNISHNSKVPSTNHEIQVYKDWLKTTGNYIRPSEMIHSRYWDGRPYLYGAPSRGGTIKYKKSLLHKQTRKIVKKKYSQKLKKYGKNKNKTLRRIRL
jgi:hypothetical protein